MKKIAKKRKHSEVKPHIDRLYKALVNYINKEGGSLVVIGGIEIQEWPSDPALVFRVGIRCMGRKPAYVKPDSAKAA